MEQISPTKTCDSINFIVMVLVVLATLTYEVDLIYDFHIVILLHVSVGGTTTP